MIHPVRILVAAAGVLFLTACSDDDTDPRLDALQGSRALWRSQHLDDYRFVQQKWCFCGADDILPTRVDVRDGEPVRAEVVADGRILPAYFAFTVDRSFEWIEGAIKSSEPFEVSYDPERGFPVSLEIGFGAPHGTLLIETSDLVPLEPAANSEPD